jgi:hypothetical protein
VPDKVRRVLVNRRLDRFDRAVQRPFAPADETLVGGHAHEQPVAPVDPVLEVSMRVIFNRAAFETFQKP